MAYKVIILYQLYMPSYFLGTFTEYPYSSLSWIDVFYISKNGRLLGIIFRKNSAINGVSLLSLTTKHVKL